MKNLTTVFCVLLLLVFFGLACKNNPLARFTNQYHCQIAGEAQPQTAEEYGKRAAKHLADNNYSAEYNECAFGAAAESIRLDPKNSEALAMRGFLYKRRAKMEADNNDGQEWRRNLELALDDLNEAIRLNPEHAFFYDVRSSIYEQSEFLDEKTQVEKTLADLTRAIELSSPGMSLTLLYLRRGDFYFQRTKDYQNAVNDFTEAIKLEPTNPEFYSKRAAAYEAIGDGDLANADIFKQGQLEKLAEGAANSVSDKINDLNASNSNKKSVPKTVSGGVLNGKASRLVQPSYPPAAKAVRAAGSVNVQVTIDENGNVILAQAASGHPLLRAAAVAAARSSKFTPTKLSGQPVKVTGVIVYNFVPE